MANPIFRHAALSKPALFFPPVIISLLLWTGLALAQDTWLLVDTGALKLSVMHGSMVVHEYRNVSIGRKGASGKKLLGDQKTPLGTFHVSSIRKDSPYHRFIGIDYPDLEYATRAHDEGTIDAKQLEAIRTAHEQGGEPPSSTPLGGRIGIHGIGEGDPRIHEDFNWTEGCIALTNEEVDELLRWVRLRMRVVII